MHGHLAEFDFRYSTKTWAVGALNAALRGIGGNCVINRFSRLAALLRQGRAPSERAPEAPD